MAKSKKAVAAAPPPDEWIVTREMKLDDAGEDVAELQRRLIAAGFAVGRAGANGFFGRDTKIAVRAYQDAHRLTINGVVGRYMVASLGGVMKSK